MADDTAPDVFAEGGYTEDLSLDGAAALLEKKLFGSADEGGGGNAPEGSPPEGDDAAPSEKEASGDDTTEAKDETASPSIAPPASWSAEDKEAFAKLPPEAQAVIARRESERDKFVSSKANEVAQERSQITAERQHYATKLSSLIGSLEAQVQDKFASVDWQRLASEDPAQYVALRAEAEQRYAQLQQAQQEHARLQHVQQQEAQQQMQAFQAAQREQLMATDPDFATPDKAKATAADMREYLTRHGITDEEMGMLTTAFALSTVKKAMLYDKLQQSKPAVEKKVATPSRVVRPGASAPGDEGESRRLSALKGNLRKTGSLRDAAKLLENFM